MPTQSIDFSHLYFGIKGDNIPQMIKNLSQIIAHDIFVPLAQIYASMDSKIHSSSAGIGDGVAIFDWISPDIKTPYIMCAKLNKPLELSVVDDKSIDIVLVLVSPDTANSLHLQTLSRMTRMFRDYQLLNSLRDISSVDGMRALLLSDRFEQLAA